jgi:hypothetical protein
VVVSLNQRARLVQPFVHHALLLDLTFKQLVRNLVFRFPRSFLGELVAGVRFHLADFFTIMICFASVVKSRH